MKVDVNIEPSVGKTIRLLECAACGRTFTPTTMKNKFCTDPKCIKHRNVVRQMDYYRRRPEYTGKVGRPRTAKPKQMTGEAGRPQSVNEAERSPQLKYYYKKKAGQANQTEKKLKEI